MPYPLWSAFRPALSTCRIAVLALLSATAMLTPSATAQQFRAVWADSFSVGFKSTSEINALVSRMVAGRYNVIIAEVLAYHDTTGGGHGAYWNSSIVPKALDISGGIDPLATLISVAHANNIEVHAWIVPWRVSNSWPPSGNALLAANPQWLMVPLASLGSGPATIGGHYTLDPGSPDAQEYLISIIRELVTNYAIDGVNLDYIRYIQTDAGYPSNSSYARSGLKRWQTITGNMTVPPVSGNASWNDFRRRGIDEFVRRARAEIPSIANPRQPLRLTADLICFGNAPANFTSSDAYNLFSNWQMWMQRGWLDAGIPMNYKREHVSNEATWYRNWVNAAINWRYDRHMFTGQGAYLNTKQNSVTQIAYALNAGANGAVTFAYDATADENTNGTPEADWNWYVDSPSFFSAPDVFSAPVPPTPPMPWRNPATATEGTVWGRIVNGTTGQPVDNASVQVGGLTAVNTDGNGFYVVTLVPATAGGTAYNVVANAAGCTQVTVSNVIAVAGGITRRDVTVCPLVPIAGDMNLDGDVNSADLNLYYFCLRGPNITFAPGNICLRGDFNTDNDVDMADTAEFQLAY